MIYNRIKRNKNNIVEIKNYVKTSYVYGPRVEILGDTDELYKVQFINKKTNSIEFETEIKTNHWCQSNVRYFVDWNIKVWKGDELFYEEDYNAKGKRIYVAIDSKALGDTLAWFPYIEEFGKVHKCKMVASTFHNELLFQQYPNIEFINPGDIAENLYGMYGLGLFYNEDGSLNIWKNPKDPKSVTMQQMATDILGLEYKEIKPRLKKTSPKKEKLITLATHGTAQSKYWNNPTGWQEVVDWLNKKGYRVKLLSKEQDGYMGNFEPKGIEKLPWGPIQGVMHEMEKSEAFIGIGSGLSWLSWAMDTKTVLISGFSYDWAEMEDCVRIGAPKDKCSGCFNRLKLDAGDWNWCPDHKGTNRQFECTKSITSEMVIKELEKFL